MMVGKRILKARILTVLLSPSNHLSLKKSIHQLFLNGRMINLKPLKDKQLNLAAKPQRDKQLHSRQTFSFLNQFLFLSQETLTPIFQLQMMTKNLRRKS